MKKLLALLAAVVAFASASAASAQDHTLRLAHSMSSAEPIHTAVEFFARNVSEKSGGRIEVSVFPSEQLGSGKNVNEMIRQGTPVINVTDPGYLSDYVPDVAVLNGPYLLDKQEDFAKILKSDWLKEADRKLQEKGFRVLSWNGLFGPRHMIADKPIRTPADVAGMTVRVPPNQMWIKTFEAMGTRPTTVEWSEIYNALSQNVIEAAEAPLGSLWGSKLGETRNTISLTSHFVAWVQLVTSEQWFATLEPDLQALMLEEGRRAGDELTRLTLGKQEELLGNFRDAGVTIVDDVDRVAFRQATAKTYEAFPSWTPGLYDDIRAILSQ
jgi:TRAP-type transport system periplasmic protein